MHRTLSLLLVAVAAAALSGCLDPAAAGDEGTGGDVPALFAPAEPKEARDGEAPGLHLEGQVRECDEGLCLDAVARNDGPATFHVSSICVDAWSDRMERDGEPALLHREPMAVCLAFGTRPMAPGDEVPFQAVWDGQVWDDEGQALRPAEPGTYEWIAMFVAYEEADGGGGHRLELSFSVVVGSS